LQKNKVLLYLNFAELWTSNSPSYSCPRSNSTCGCLDSSFYLPVSLKELITYLDSLCLF